MHDRSPAQHHALANASRTSHLDPILAVSVPASWNIGRVHEQVSVRNEWVNPSANDVFAHGMVRARVSHRGGVFVLCSVQCSEGKGT